MFAEGIICEDSFTPHNIPLDVFDARGNVVYCRDVGISMEHCQRSKLLSSAVQIRNCMELVNGKRMTYNQKQVDQYKKGNQDYERNVECEHKLCALVMDVIDSEAPLEFSAILNDIACELSGSCEGACLVVSFFEEPYLTGQENFE